MGSIYTSVASGAIFPLHEHLKSHDSVARRKDLERTQYLPLEQILALRNERLKRFLMDIGTHVPYYRDLFREQGFDPAAYRGLEDLQRLPFLTKPLIRENVDKLRADDSGPVTRYNTGGSSGEPLIFYIGKARKSHDVAAKWRATRWWGVDIGDPEIVLWGSPIELGAQDRVKALRDRLLRSWLLPAFEMSDDKVRAMLAQIREVRPKMLFGYPSALAHLAERARLWQIPVNDLGIKVAFVTSEMLYDHQKQSISEIFGCPVANGYGARDAGFIAHQCPHGSLHISAEDIVVETIAPDGSPVPPGAPGEIVVTHMATRDFPFVRYRTGDVGVLANKPCSCGIKLPVLAEVQGRTTDFITGADGTVIHALALIYTVRDLPGVQRFKIVQHSIERTEVLVVADERFGEHECQRIRSDFAARLGASVQVDISSVSEIPPEKSGKTRYVVSHVKP
ncbi:MAG: phenylacetate--CoA ligase family protein [Proteobacteria bacterium]|nr:phenylacetate--CoA ligase family protein [Pseudomonadota bacterium]